MGIPECMSHYMLCSIHGVFNCSWLVTLISGYQYIDIFVFSNVIYCILEKELGFTSKIKLHGEKWVYEQVKIVSSRKLVNCCPLASAGRNS